MKHIDGEYVRGIVHTNTVENVFSVFKRGMTGVYRHCGEVDLLQRPRLFSVMVEPISPMHELYPFAFASIQAFSCFIQDALGVAGSIAVYAYTYHTIAK